MLTKSSIREHSSHKLKKKKWKKCVCNVYCTRNENSFRIWSFFNVKYYLFSYKKCSWVVGLKNNIKWTYRTVEFRGFREYHKTGTTFFLNECVYGMWTVEYWNMFDTCLTGWCLKSFFNNEDQNTKYLNLQLAALETLLPLTSFCCYIHQNENLKTKFIARRGLVYKMFSLINAIVYGKN